MFLAMLYNSEVVISALELKPLKYYDHYGVHEYNYYSAYFPLIESPILIFLHIML